jgi:hypothetical protein
MWDEQSLEGFRCDGCGSVGQCTSQRSVARLPRIVVVRFEPPPPTAPLAVTVQGWEHVYRIRAAIIYNGTHYRCIVVPDRPGVPAIIVDDGATKDAPDGTIRSVSGDAGHLELSAPRGWRIHTVVLEASGA